MLDGAAPAELSRLNKRFHFAIYEMSSPLVLQYVEALRDGDAETAGKLTADHVRHAASIRERHPELRASGVQDREESL